MKEGIGQNPQNQEAVQASFFKIDPENWPDLPPPVIKPKKQRNPYRLLGVARFTDPPPAENLEAAARIGLDSGVALSPIPNFQDYLAELKAIKQIKEEREEAKRQVRRRGRELIQEYRSGKVSFDDVSDFYQNEATNLVSEKAYQNHQEYAAKNNRRMMSWPDYAKEVVLELLSADLMSLGQFPSRTPAVPETKRG